MWQVCPKPREDKTQSLPVVNVLLNITKTSKQVKAEKNVRNRGVSRNEMTAFQSRFYHPVCWTQGNEFKEIYCNEIWKTLIQSDVHFDNKTRYIENSSPQSGQKYIELMGTMPQENCTHGTNSFSGSLSTSFRFSSLSHSSEREERSITKHHPMTIGKE